MIKNDDNSVLEGKSQIKGGVISEPHNLYDEMFEIEVSTITKMDLDALKVLYQLKTYDEIIMLLVQAWDKAYNQQKGE